jgi:hypothetical protein
VGSEGEATTKSGRRVIILKAISFKFRVFELENKENLEYYRKSSCISGHIPWLGY